MDKVQLMARQNPFEKSGNGPEPAAYIPPPASKARRNRDWEAKHRDVVAYRGVPAELQAEIKAIAGLTGSYEAQIINYLKATGLKVGLLINFGAKSLEHKRLVYGF